MGDLKKVDPEIYQAIYKETLRENENLELIASENMVSEAVLEAQGSVLTNKYAEGYSHKRWYGGCEYVDIAENLAAERAKKLFRAEHANVQPHSGTQANMAIFFAFLNIGDTILAMDLSSGGHLTHGHPLNFSGRYFKVATYGVSRRDEKIDYNEVKKIAQKHKPKLIIAGACAYPRIINFREFRKIADRVGAYLLVDMAHIAGLVAAGLHPTPVPYAEFVTTTTNKTLRGPRGGMVLCKKEFAKKIDIEVFPGIQGGPLMHIIAAKAVALKEASTQPFKEYQRQIIKNASALSRELAQRNYRIVSGGTDNHLLLMDLTYKGLTGKEAAEILDRAKITVNKNLIPFDTKSPAITSGIRLGTPGVTTRGMKEPQMREIADWIDSTLSEPTDANLKKVKEKVARLTQQFPLYKDRIGKMEKELKP